jgi:DNA-directed RNA polymerase specialized sigma24 family protein
MRILTLRIDLATTVARLRPRCRELFGRIVAGESAEAIAAAMCMSGNNLRVTLHDCRRKAREIYARLTNRNATPR